MGGAGLAAHQKNVTRRRAHLVFLDETGFSLDPTVRRSWGLIGQTPIHQHAARHWKKITAIGAITISPQRRRLDLFMMLIRAGSITQDEVLAFLNDLLRHLRGHVVVVLDRLSQHRSRVVREAMDRRRRVTLEYFPPYAPELNPVEYLWAQLKGHRLSNHGLRTLEALESGVCEEARSLRRDRNLLRSCLEHSPLPLRLPPRGHYQRRSQ